MGLEIPPRTSNPNSYQWNYSQIQHTQQGPNYWKVTFDQSLYIKTFAIINRDENYYDKLPAMFATVGTNSDPRNNTICKGKSTMTEGGWYRCPIALYGNVFGICVNGYSGIDYV